MVQAKDAFKYPVLSLFLTIINLNQSISLQDSIGKSYEIITLENIDTQLYQCTKHNETISNKFNPNIVNNLQNTDKLLLIELHSQNFQPAEEPLASNIQTVAFPKREVVYSCLDTSEQAFKLLQDQFAIESLEKTAFFLFDFKSMEYSIVRDSSQAVWHRFEDLESEMEEKELLSGLFTLSFISEGSFFRVVLLMLVTLAVLISKKDSNCGVPISIQNPFSASYDSTSELDIQSRLRHSLMNNLEANLSSLVPIAHCEGRK